MVGLRNPVLHSNTRRRLGTPTQSNQRNTTFADRNHTLAAQGISSSLSLAILVLQLRTTKTTVFGVAMTDVLTRRITLRVAIGLSAIALAGTPSESQAPKDPAVET